MAAAAESKPAAVQTKPAGKSKTELLILQTIAGAGSGAFTKTATAPLERIKIIFQVQVREGSWLLGLGN